MKKILIDERLGKILQLTNKIVGAMFVKNRILQVIFSILLVCKDRAQRTKKHKSPQYLQLGVKSDYLCSTIHYQIYFSKM